MRNLIYICLFSWGLQSCFPVRMGKQIDSVKLDKNDSLVFLGSYVVYSRVTNSFTDNNKPNEQQIAFEKFWKNTHYEILRRRYSLVDETMFFRKNEWQEREFDFKYNLRRTDPVYSDSVNYLMTKTAWKIKDANVMGALEIIPDSVIKKSFLKPIVFFTTYMTFYETSYQTLYMEGSTGLMFSPKTMFVLIQKGEVNYFSSDQRLYSFKRFQKNEMRETEKITYQLLKKL